MQGNRLNHKSIMTKCLSFHEKKTEEAYDNFNRGYKQNYLRFFQLVILIVIAGNWLLNPLGTDNYSGNALILNLIQICVNILGAVFLYYKKEFKHPELGIFLLQIYNCAGYVETFQKNFSLHSRTIFITTSTLLELNCLISMISRSSWKINGLSSFILNTYLSLRFTNISDNREMRGLPSLVFLGNFLIITLGAYFHEKYDRNLFYERFHTEQSLRRFEEIIREVLPNSILIFKNNENVFFNEQTKRLLRISNKTELEGQLSKIVVDCEMKENMMIDAQNAGNEQNFVETRNKQQILLSFFSLVADYPEIEGFVHLNGKYKVQNNPKKKEDLNFPFKNEETETFLDIKIGKFDWEGDEALLVIISENLVAQRLQYLQEQAKYKDLLLATVSHDLRTPLNGIMGILDHTLELNIERELRKGLQLALRSSNLLLFMINDILDFSQIANGELNVSPVHFRPDEMISDVSKLIKFQAKKKGIALEIKNFLPSDEAFFLYSDPNRLKQVIFNLLGNALKFTQKGFVRISLEYFTEDGSAANSLRISRKLPLKISVEDTGCGIKEEDFPKLFKLFGMLKETKKINKTGVGLGLAISQNLVKILNNHRPGCEITVKSEYGKGSVFSFPIHHFSEPEAPNPVENRINIAEDQINLKEASVEFIGDDPNNKILSVRDLKTVFSKTERQKRILIVDDDQINILVLTSFIKDFKDCCYFTAVNGEEALDLVKKKAKNNEYFDIIFMDCNMPVMDGFEASKKIMELVSNKEIPFLYIIASTANASQADKENCRNSGMVDQIVKPLTKQSVREKIDSFANKLFGTHL